MMIIMHGDNDCDGVVEESWIRDADLMEVDFEIDLMIVTVAIIVVGI